MILTAHQEQPETDPQENSTVHLGLFNFHPSNPEVKGIYDGIQKKLLALQEVEKHFRHFKGYNRPLTPLEQQNASDIRKIVAPLLQDPSWAIVYNEQNCTLERHLSRTFDKSSLQDTDCITALDWSYRVSGRVKISGHKGACDNLFKDAHEKCFNAPCGT